MVATPIIQSIQPFTITITTAATAGTAAINNVNTSNAFILPNGVRNNSAIPNSYERAQLKLQLTSSVLVTAARTIVSPTTTIVTGTVIEFANFVNSIQTGTITVTTATTGNTAAINAVSTRAFIVFQGAAIEAPTSYSGAHAAVKLNSSVEVQAIVTPSSLSASVQFAVVDLSSYVVETVEAIDLSVATTSTVDVATITAVDMARTLVIDGGRVSTGSLPGSQVPVTNFGFLTNLAGVTSVEFARGGAATSLNTVTRRHLATVVQFKAQALATTVQRGTVDASTSAGVTGTAAITAVTTLGFLNCPYHQARATSASNVASYALSLSLASSVQVAATRFSSVNSIQGRYEVVQWATAIEVASGIRPDWNTHGIETGVFRGLHPIDHGVKPYSIVERSI